MNIACFNPYRFKMELCDFFAKWMKVKVRTSWGFEVTERLRSAVSLAQKRVPPLRWCCAVGGFKSEALVWVPRAFCRSVMPPPTLRSDKNRELKVFVGFWKRIVGDTVKRMQGS